MSYTFEIVFSDLVFFAFTSGAYPDYGEMYANLIRTEEGRYSTCESSVRLSLHRPILHFSASLIRPVFQPEGAFLCREHEGWWTCDLTDLDLEVHVSDYSSDFKVREGRTKGGPQEPNRATPEAAFNWITHLAWIDEEVGGLRPEAYQTADGSNALVAARIRSRIGELVTRQVTRREGFLKWQVCPDRQGGSSRDHPKTVADSMKLVLRSIPDGRVVQLRKHQDPGSYIELQPLDFGATPYVTVANKMDSALDPHVGSGPGQCKWRLRHFLWYYELVTWDEGCPTAPLCAPVCPGKSCERRAGGNYFCPPATYP